MMVFMHAMIFATSFVVNQLPKKVVVLPCPCHPSSMPPQKRLMRRLGRWARNALKRYMHIHVSLDMFLLLLLLQFLCVVCFLVVVVFLEFDLDMIYFKTNIGKLCGCRPSL